MLKGSKKNWERTLTFLFLLQISIWIFLPSFLFYLFHFFLPNAVVVAVFSPICCKYCMYSSLFFIKKKNLLLWWWRFFSSFFLFLPSFLFFFYGHVIFWDIYFSRLDNRRNRQMKQKCLLFFSFSFFLLLYFLHVNCNHFSNPSFLLFSICFLSSFAIITTTISISTPP